MTAVVAGGSDPFTSLHGDGALHPLMHAALFVIADLIWLLRTWKPELQEKE